MCIFAIEKTKNDMGIKRNEVAEPQWNDWDYAKIDKENLFSNNHWKRTINWNLLLEHVKNTENACQLVNGAIYPSRLFTAYIDILEANIHILNDIFYYETGIPPKPVNKDIWFFQVIHCLRFWNMDWYKEMKMIYEGFYRIGNHLISSLEQKSLSEIADEVFKICKFAKSFQTTRQESCDYTYHRAYSYAQDAYRDSETDKNALTDQIVYILKNIRSYTLFLDYLLKINYDSFGNIQFKYLLEMFRKSRRADYFITPWRHDFMGSRDNLILKMEKNPELGPWVNRYTHLREGVDDDKAVQLFCDEFGNVKNIEETFNTDNWIHVLTVAAILQEYDEQHDVSQHTATESDQTENDDLLIKLSSFFIDEDTARRFLKQIQGMKDRKIATLVNSYHTHNLCSDTSKDLWEVLHDANLYKSGYKNWNAQLKIKST